MFPYKRILITAKSKEEARDLANIQAQKLKESLKHSIDKIKMKSRNIDEFL